jgi:large subunit ribosomal protein L25
MEEILLKVERRSVIGKQVKALRRQGKLPGVMYGHNVEPTPILMNLHETSRILGPLSPSALVTVELEGEKHITLVREKQLDYIKNIIKHIDFQVVSMKEKLRARVTVVVIGLSPAVKDFNGVLVEGLDEIEVECLPQDLPAKIEVDISNLIRIGDSINVRDVILPPNVIALDDPDEMVVVVTAQAAEEKVEEVVVVAEGLEPEVIEKGKIEEGEEAEGEKPVAKE